MKKIARFFYHIGRNLIFRNYRYFRLTANEKGKIFFYDRDGKNFFSIYSRGFIDSVTANQIYSNNEYNFDFVGKGDQVKERYENILSSGMTPVIVDCGANIGLSSQYFARKFPKAKIVAIEPNMDNCKSAERHCASFENVKVYNAAIGSKSGFVAIEDELVDDNAFQVVRIEAQDGIELKTIPDIFAEYKSAGLFIVKVDIEGFERDLFKENTNWIAECDVLIVELHDWMLPKQGSSSNFIKAIGFYERDFLFKGESVFSFKNIH